MWCCTYVVSNDTTYGLGRCNQLLSCQCCQCCQCRGREWAHLYHSHLSAANKLYFLSKLCLIFSNRPISALLRNIQAERCSALTVNSAHPPSAVQDPHYFFRFLYIVKSPSGQPLRDTLAEHPEAKEALLELLRVPADESTEEPDATFHAVQLVSAVAKLKPQWLSANKPVMDRVFERWRSPAREARIQVSPLLPVTRTRAHTRARAFTHIQRLCLTHAHSKTHTITHTHTHTHTHTRPRF
jgi:hypothetical protein